jgi:hypothetical protein
MKISVPIYVFEDTLLGNGAQLRDAVGSPSGTVDSTVYQFAWHAKYNAIGGIGVPRPALTNTVDGFRAAQEELSALSGNAILFFDLHHVGADERTLGLVEDDVPIPAFEALRRLMPDLLTRHDALKWANPFRLGLLLALTAASNPDWAGVITFASMQENIDETIIAEAAQSGDRLVWRDAGQALSVGATVERRAALVHDAIKAFLESKNRGPAWWELNTSKWFRDKNQGTAPPPWHDLSVEAVEPIKDYLRKVCPNFVPPDSWFDGPFGVPKVRQTQAWALFESLKGLIGYDTVCEGNCTKNLRLGALPLLLAAQMSFRGADIQWFTTYDWRSKAATDEVMPHKTRDSGRAGVRAMAEFLGLIGTAEDNTAQVHQVCWGLVAGDDGQHLFIDLKLDPLRVGDKSPKRNLLQAFFGTRWGERSGETMKAYERMMTTVLDTSGQSKFRFCVYPVSLPKNAVGTRLDFRSRE